MRNVFKPASFLMYLLVILSFFFIGLFVAKYTGAGKNQGLAGGAIVLFYGIITAAIAFVVSIVLTYKLELKHIILLNKVLGIVLILLTVTIYFQVKAKQKEKDDVIVLPPKTEAIE